MTMQTITLTGNLGRDPVIRHTQEYKHRTPTRYVSDEDYEYVVPESERRSGGREFLVLSMATNTRTRKGWNTQWHRLVAWDPDRLDIRAARICRKGAKVRVTGVRDSFTTFDGRVIEQLIIKDFEIIDLRAPKLP
jgi:single-stranded DNA-binding protein